MTLADWSFFYNGQPLATTRGLPSTKNRTMSLRQGVWLEVMGL